MNPFFVPMNLSENTKLVKQYAKTLGFEACGFSKAEELKSEKEFLEKWLGDGLHAAMHYMENNFEKRIDPTKLVDGAKSVISVVYNYFPKEQQYQSEAPVVSKYAYGVDYHFVMKDKLKVLMQYINDNVGVVNGRIFVDSAPVLDRAWAARSGIGWIGKNTNLIVPNVGSFVFIGELIVDMEFEYDSAIKERCGSCTKCISACPTNALVKPYLLDSKRCISFLTIENKDEIADEFKGRLNNRVYGCDICQDVCPWNKDHKATSDDAFAPHPGLLSMSKDDWFNMNEERYRELFRKSAIKRAKYAGLQRNIQFLKEASDLKGHE